MKLSHKIFKTIVTLLFFTIDSLTLLFSKFFFKEHKINTTLFINMGALGDSFIFFNSILQFNKKHEVHCLINSNAKLLFSQYEDLYFESVNSKKYVTNIFYRIRVNLKLSKYRFNNIVNVRGSRNGIYEDSLIRFIKGRKIALKSDFGSNSFISLKLFDFFVYNRIIEVDLKKNIHEFERINIIFNDILEEKFSIKILDLAFHLRSMIDKKLLTENYFVLNVGAGKSFRKWDINNFIQLGNALEKKLGIKAVYCGLNQDRKNIENAKINLSENSLNLCGETSIENIVNIIKYANFSVSNDSASAHISILLNKNTVCIKSLFDEKRFLPYPTHLMNENIKIISKKNIDDINVKQVLNLIDF